MILFPDENLVTGSYRYTLDDRIVRLRGVAHYCNLICRYTQHAGDPAARVYQQVDLKVGVATERSYETYLGITESDFEANPYRRYAASQKGLMNWWRSQGEATYSLSFEDLIEFQATAYRHDFSRSWRKFNSFAGGPSIYDIMADTGSGQAAIYLAILKGEEDSADGDQTLLIGTNARSYVSQGVQNVLRISPKTKHVD